MKQMLLKVLKFIEAWNINAQKRLMIEDVSNEKRSVCTTFAKSRTDSSNKINHFYFDKINNSHSRARMEDERQKTFGIRATTRAVLMERQKVAKSSAYTDSGQKFDRLMIKIKAKKDSISF